MELKSSISSVFLHAVKHLKSSPNIIHHTVPLLLTGSTIAKIRQNLSSVLFMTFLITVATRQRLILKRSYQALLYMAILEQHSAHKGWQHSSSRMAI